MEKFQRNERIAVLVKMLSDFPGKVFTLSSFTEMFGCAKSTISEDIDILQNLASRFDLGTIETIPGASGGVRFAQTIPGSIANEIAQALCTELSKKERILPGGYLYMLDIIYDPVRVSEIARIFASRFHGENIDYVITVETKGIPLALITAKYLNVPLVIARHYSEATDGPSVNINYVSGSSRKIETMVLSLKALKRSSRILFIDDFMRAGGTAKGIVDLAKEFDSEVAGIGVLIETAAPAKKLVDEHFSILTLNSVNEEEGIVNIKPSASLC
ncbi:MAG: pur operon repressor [Clostridia bacterium]|nr:pur operon repressor [Clostridia bacterium]